MKKLFYSLVLALALATTLVFAACTSGGNVDDTDGAVSTNVSSSDMTSSDASSGSMLGDVVSDIKEDVGMNNSNSDSASSK